MFYKELNNRWYVGKNIFLPSGEELNETNKLELDGWFWSDEDPEEYTIWKNEQELE